MAIPFEYDPTRMIRKLENSGDFTREELTDFWGCTFRGYLVMDCKKYRQN